MRWTHFDQLHNPSTHFNIEATVEGACRRRKIDAIEFEIAKEMSEQLADLTRCIIESSQHRRRNLHHLVCSCTGSNDFCTCYKLVAITVVAVGMRVYNSCNRCAACCNRHRIEHGRREP